MEGAPTARWSCTRLHTDCEMWRNDNNTTTQSKIRKLRLQLTRFAHRREPLVKGKHHPSTCLFHAHALEAIGVLMLAINPEEFNPALPQR
eukprot:5273920-Amphidinium_carterae.1